MSLLEGLGSFLTLVLFFALMWFLIIRPQQVQQRRRQEMLARVKRGDEVITIGGIHGKVKAVSDDTIQLEIAEGVVVQMNKTGVGLIKESGGQDKN
ncbi:MAG TPA: preprotein translocase subunit YajC [Bacillota bacterium]